MLESSKYHRQDCVPPLPPPPTPDSYVEAWITIVTVFGDTAYKELKLNESNCTWS